MNYLAICQRVRQESSDAGTGPTAVANQTGQLRRIVDWVASAWDEIQGRHPDWLWMRSRFTVETSEGDDTYAGTDCTDSRLSATVTRFARWWPTDSEGYSNVNIYKQSDGVGTERPLPYIDWASFRHLYRRGTQNNGVPAHFSIDPQNNLVLGPKPNGIFVVSGEYQMSGQTLDEDDDTPECPTRFHMLIVWRAVEKAGAFNVASEHFTRAVRDGNRLMAQLELDQRPPVASAGPLA